MKLSVPVVASTIAICMLSTARELFAQDGYRGSPEDLLFNQLAREPAMIIPLAGIACGMFAILVVGIVNIFRAIFGGRSNEEVLDRLDALDERLARMEASIKQQNEARIDQTAAR